MIKNILISVLISAFIFSFVSTVFAGPLITKETISHYKIYGNSKEELVKQMELFGPPFPPEIRKRKSWAWTGIDRDKKKNCTIVLITNNIILPRWVENDGASRWLNWNWKRMLRALKRHERGHARINNQSGRIHLANKCKKWDATKENRKWRSNRFDKFTNNGIYTGAFLF